MGIPSDNPEKHPRGIPDTRNIPLWVLIAVLGVPMVLLWWRDRSLRLQEDGARQAV